MWDRFRLLVLIILISVTASHVQAQLYDLLADKDYVEIPFRFESNFIIVDVRLNGAFPMNFIFDTGAEHTLLFKKTYTDLLGVDYGKQIKIFGSDLQSYVYANIVRNVQFRVPPLDDVRMDFLVMQEDYIKMDELIGLNIDGILGAQFFRHHIIKIDYRRGILTMYKKEKFPKPGNKYIPYPVNLKRNKPYISARSYVNQIDSAQLTLLLDTGASIGLMLHSNTHENLKLPDNYIQTSLGQGIGGEISGYLGRVAKFSISNFSFSNVIAGFQDITVEAVEDKIVKRNGIIGNQILSRFTIIIDYPHSIIYFKPERKFKQKFDYDKSGLTIGATGTYLNDYRVMYVLDDSPAAEAGIKEEDRIMKMNGVPTSLFNLSKVTRMLRKKDGKRVTLVIKRGDERFKTTITLRKLL